MQIRLVYTGRSYQHSQALPEALELPDGVNIDDALRVIGEHLAEGQELPSTCLVTVGGEHLGTVASHSDRVLRDGEELVLIAPVAGG